MSFGLFCMQRKRSAATLSPCLHPKGQSISTCWYLHSQRESHRPDGHFVSDSKTVLKNGCLQIKAQSQQRLFARNEMSCASSTAWVLTSAAGKYRSNCRDEHKHCSDKLCRGLSTSFIPQFPSCKAQKDQKAELEMCLSPSSQACSHSKASIFHFCPCSSHSSPHYSHFLWMAVKKGMLMGMCSISRPFSVMCCNFPLSFTFFSTNSTGMSKGFMNFVVCWWKEEKGKILRKNTEELQPH